MRVEKRFSRVLTQSLLEVLHEDLPLGDQRLHQIRTLLSKGPKLPFRLQSLKQQVEILELMRTHENSYSRSPSCDEPLARARQTHRRLQIESELVCRKKLGFLPSTLLSSSSFTVASLDSLLNKCLSTEFLRIRSSRSISRLLLLTLKPYHHHPLQPFLYVNNYRPHLYHS